LANLHGTASQHGVVQIADQPAYELSFFTSGRLIEVFERTIPLTAAQERAGIPKDDELVARPRQGNKEGAWIRAIRHRAMGMATRQTEKHNICFALWEAGSDLDLQTPVDKSRCQSYQSPDQFGLRRIERDHRHRRRCA